MTALIAKSVPGVWLEICFERFAHLWFDKMGVEKSQQSLAQCTLDTLDDKDVLVCTGCRTRISSNLFLVTVQDQVQHTKTNPDGMSFTLRCFSQAWHLNMLGTPTLENTWFPGFAWQIAYCSSCGLHLGWVYKATAESFFGLINENLVDSSQ